MTDLSAKLPHASQATRDANPGLFGDGTLEQTRTLEQSELPNMPKSEQAEPEFQREAEKYLEARGYRRRTQREIQRHHLGLWYIHMIEAQNNPIILDLVLIDSTRGPYDVRAMEIELKVKGGRLSVEQRCLTSRKEGVVVWNMEQFEEAYMLWRKSVNEGAV